MENDGSLRWNAYSLFESVQVDGKKDGAWEGISDLCSAYQVQGRKGSK